MIDSMFSSMTSSMQLAKDCLKEDQQASEYITETATPFEGLEMFAQTIESGKELRFWSVRDVHSNNRVRKGI